MKGIEIRIATDNMAFMCYGPEVARILRALADRVEGCSVPPMLGVLPLPVIDANGNWVGEARFGVNLPRGWPRRGGKTT